MPIERMTVVRIVKGVVWLLGACVTLYTVYAIALGLSRSISTFTVSPNPVVRGQSVVVSWKTTGISTDVLLDGEKVPPAGIREVPNLQQNHTFTLVVRNRLGRTEAVPIAVTVKPPPIEVKFDPYPLAVKPGETVTVSWHASRNATEIYIEPLIGNVGHSGKRSVVLHESTTFKITATGKDAAPFTKEVTVTVLQTELSARVDPETIRLGEQAKLTWATNAESVQILPDAGVVTGATGEKIVSPQATTEFELIANGPGGERRVSVRLNVLPPRPPDPPAIRAWPVSLRVPLGQTAEIQWQATNANQVFVDYEGARQSFLPVGRFQLKPNRRGQIEVRLTAVGAGGESNARVYVEVLPPVRPKILVLDAQMVSGYMPPALANDATDALRSYLRNHEYAVVMPSQRYQSVQQFLDYLAYAQSSGQQANTADWIAQVALETHAEQRKSTKTEVLDRMRRALNQPSQDSYEVSVTWQATISFYSVADRRQITSGRGEATDRKIVWQGDMYVYSRPDSDFSREVSRRAVEDALKNLELQQ